MLHPQDNPTLKKILDEMDIPEQRKNDEFWLLRNIGIKESNRQHPEYRYAEFALKLLCNENC